MATIQVVLDKALLKAADQAARRAKVNRSALIREALREHLKKLRVTELEDRERRAYEKVPDRADEFAEVLSEAVWPDD